MGKKRPNRGFYDQSLPQDSNPIDNVTEKDLMELSRKAGPALPILRGKDVGLPKRAPVFDFEQMKEKNRQGMVAIALKKRNANGG